MFRETLTLIKTILFDTPWKEICLFAAMVFLMCIVVTVLTAIVLG